MFGDYPTPVALLKGLSTRDASLWVKRDDQTNALYGGNKVRKLEHILQEAGRRRAKRIVTFGAAGSHHVLATALHAGREGYGVAAVLTPQPRSEHAMENLRAALGAGLEAAPAPTIAHVPLALARLVRRGDYVVPPGGSNAIASVGYAEAVRELADQVHRSELPEPDAIVVALGSGGTAAGIVAGVVRAGLRSVVIGVRVVDPPLVTRAATLLLARGVSRRLGRRDGWRSLSRAFVMEPGKLGRGYGYPTTWGAAATERAASEGLTLEPTYTAKAFAYALELIERRRYRDVLYWHTLSGADLAPLVAAGPEERDVPSGLRGLLRGS